MDISPNVLRKEVVETLNSIHAVEEAIRYEAKQHNLPPEALRNSDGTWVMIPVLFSKTQCLNTLILLRDKE